MIVCVVVKVLPLVIFRLSVKSPLVLRVIPRYLYVLVASSVVLLAQWITWLTRDRCNPKVLSSIPAGGKYFL